MGITISNLDQMKMWLREEFRMKDGTDYAVVMTFGKTHVLAPAALIASIKEAAEKFNVSITSVNIIQEEA